MGLSYYFCKNRRDWFLGRADDFVGESDQTLKCWASKHPAGRAPFSEPTSRLRAAKANSAREELLLRGKQDRWFRKSHNYIV